jgi:hypothetical protein
MRTSNGPQVRGAAATGRLRLLDAQNRYLTSVSVTLLVLGAILAGLTLAMPVRDASAMGQGPSSCNNVYGGTITSFLITYPPNNTTFDARASPNATFAMPSVDATYSVAFVIHVASVSDSISNPGNSLPGDTWYTTTALGYAYSVCVPGAAPNRDLKIEVTVPAPSIAGHTDIPITPEWQTLAPGAGEPAINTAVFVEYSVMWPVLTAATTATTSASTVSVGSRASTTTATTAANTTTTTTTTSTVAATSIASRASLASSAERATGATTTSISTTTETVTVTSTATSTRSTEGPAKTFTQTLTQTQMQTTTVTVSPSMSSTTRDASATYHSYNNNTAATRSNLTQSNSSTATAASSQSGAQGQVAGLGPLTLEVLAATVIVTAVAVLGGEEIWRKVTAKHPFQLRHRS